MADASIIKLLRLAPLSFFGTVESTGIPTVGDVPAVVRVDRVLHAPEAFATLGGQRVTLDVAADADPLEVGDRGAFFAQGVIFGESITVSEVGRLAVEDVEPHLTEGRAGLPGGFAELERQIEIDLLREHASNSDAVVVGRVVRLEKALQPSASEHDPDWWTATLEVRHVERGDVQAGEVPVLYANSLDVRWRTSPKPKASQDGTWILHATEGELRTAAPFQILHPEDRQPTRELDSLRGRPG
jgi:hypothetical protein